MFEQTIIALTAALAIWMVNDTNEKIRRPACLIGLIGQPFWLIATFMAEQWGMFLVSVFYTVAWGKGVYYLWVTPLLARRKQGSQKAHPSESLYFRL